MKMQVPSFFCSDETNDGLYCIFNVTKRCLIDTFFFLNSDLTLFNA